jgi:predicted Fe-S protein YdhL (DUF1289 family)
VDGQSGLCLGCFRTLGEIGGWSRYSDAERSAIMADLPKRRNQIDPALLKSWSPLQGRRRRSGNRIAAPASWGRTLLGRRTDERSASPLQLFNQLVAASLIRDRGSSEAAGVIVPLTGQIIGHGRPPLATGPERGPPGFGIMIQTSGQTSATPQRNILGIRQTVWRRNRSGSEGQCSKDWNSNDLHDFLQG